MKSHLVQLLLPLRSNEGKRFPRAWFTEIKQELTTQFSGLTAYNRTPAEGLWKPGRTAQTEEIIVYEVMVERFNPKWWQRYRRILEKRFRQHHLVVRVYRITQI